MEIPAFRDYQYHILAQNGSGEVHAILCFFLHTRHDRGSLTRRFSMPKLPNRQPCPPGSEVLRCSRISAALFNQCAPYGCHASTLSAIFSSPLHGRGCRWSTG